MCGIAGLITADAGDKVGSMLSAIQHRGFDDEGVWTSGALADGTAVSLGHRRLSIIDTSLAGHQPMLSADGRFVLTFNGEIYNYRELRKQLVDKGRMFATETDTEVLIQAFAEWGEGCLERLNGMYAFAIWDVQTEKLTVARDHVGIKPVYYSQVTKHGQTSFLFASEVKAILATGIVDRAFNFEALNQYLTFLWTPDPHTLFSGIAKLPPGHVLTVHNGAVNVRQWWDISFDEIEEGRSEEQWTTDVLETMDRVVNMEMVADVPLGSFLSGGVDSSLIGALATKRGNGRRLSTYTIGTSKQDLKFDIITDDVVWARRVGKLLDTDYHEMMLEPDVVDLLPKLVYHMDEPVADPAIISSYLVSRAAKETLTVLLSGVGGDEVFAGYPRQLAMKLAGAFDPVPAMLRRPVMHAVAAALPGGLPGRFTAPLRNAKKFARSASLEFEDRYLGFGTYFTKAGRDRLYSDDVHDLVQGLDPYCEHRRYFKKVERAHPLNQLLYVDLKTFLPCLNLSYTDKTSMAATLEVRVPFLNREVLALGARMPAEYKLRGLKRKYILKKAAERLLPSDIVWRKKAGFGAPIRSWLRGALAPMVNDLLSPDNIRRRGLFDPAEVQRIIRMNLSGREDFNLQVYQLLTLELWQRTFLDV